MHRKFSPPQQHQVFISFRGAQLRYNFISHLEAALRRDGINVFIDKQENKGEAISNLLKRIDDSRIAIVVFSSRYTESNWCLREAEKIMERVAQDMLKVLPIFYKVTTENVKHLKGEFGDNFRDREREYSNNRFVIEKWKEAIAFISHKFGLELDEKSYESDFVESIVKEVLRMLAEIPSATQIAKSQINQVSGKGETSENVASKALEKKPRGRNLSTSAPRAANAGIKHNIPSNQRNNQSHVDMSEHPNMFSSSYRVHFSPSQTSWSFNTTDHGFPASTSTTASWFETGEESDDNSEEGEDWPEHLRL